VNKQEQHIRNLIRTKIHQKNPDAEIILFGSHARGDSNSNSDWDILILLNNLKVDRKLEKEYREELFGVELEVGEPISTLVFSKKDWETKHSITPLYINVKRDGIVL
jgi:predicted nucleotidyltransferase